jgi:hypothetical protein
MEDTTLSSRQHNRRSLLSSSKATANKQRLVQQQQQPQSLNNVYQANYTAQFQLVRGPSCQSPAPILRVACRRDIAVTAVSNEVIVCDTDPTLDSVGWRYLECTVATTCNPSVDNEETGACGDIFPGTFPTNSTMPWPSIDFTCAGTVVTDVDASVQLSLDTATSTDATAATATGTESATAVCSGSGSDAYIYNVVRLGVACPSESSDVSVTTTTTEYIFDDYYMECGTGASSHAGLDVEHPGDLYMCLTGGACLPATTAAGGSPVGECTIAVPPFVVRAELSHFASECVQTSDPLQHPVVWDDTIPPVDDETSDLYVTTSRFIAAWSLLFDLVSGRLCADTTPTVRISCLRDSTLQLVFAPQTTNCTMTSPSVMECIDTNRDSFVDQFTNVFYVSGVPMKRCENALRFPLASQVHCRLVARCRIVRVPLCPTRRWNIPKVTPFAMGISCRPP